jgi:Ca2+-binding EF-hand superfamily protein
MKRIGLLTLGLAFALSFGFAQDSTSTDTSTSMSAGMLGDFSSYDADADGALTADELGQGLLTAYDTNADGSVDETEFDAMASMMGGATSTDSAATTTDSSSTDTASGTTDSSSTDTSTADSSTSTDTSTATATAGSIGDFASFDANADGLLDASELGQGFVTVYDTSGTGSLSQTDFDSLASALGGSSTPTTEPTQ